MWGWRRPEEGLLCPWRWAVPHTHLLLSGPCVGCASERVDLAKPVRSEVGMRWPGAVTGPGSLKGTETGLGPTSAGLVLTAHFSTLIVCTWAFPTFLAVESSSVEIVTEVFVGHGKQLPHVGVQASPPAAPHSQGGPRGMLRPVDSAWSTRIRLVLCVRGAALCLMGCSAASCLHPPNASRCHLPAQL